MNTFGFLFLPHNSDTSRPIGQLSIVEREGQKIIEVKGIRLGEEIIIGRGTYGGMKQDTPSETLKTNVTLWQLLGISEKEMTGVSCETLSISFTEESIVFKAIGGNTVKIGKDITYCPYFYVISEIARNHKDLSHTTFIQGRNSPFKVLIHDTKGTGTFGFNVYFVRLEDGLVDVIFFS